MCGRYTLRRFDASEYDAAPRFEEFDEKQIIPRFNIAPSQLCPIIRLDKSDQRVASMVKWGLIPSWNKSLPKVQPINARSETVQSSGMFKTAFARRRCLVPVDGFYEWKKTDDSKQPYFIHLPSDEPFAFAGLWERWSANPDDKAIDTFTIITTTPNDVMAQLHDRMPVILHRQDFAKWLDRETSTADAFQLLVPYSDKLDAYPVSRAVNSPKNDSPDNVVPQA